MHRDLKSMIRGRVVATFSAALRIFPVVLIRWFFDASLRAMHESGPNWITVHARPKSGTEAYYLPMNPIPLGPDDKYAIVLQGPIATVDDFTLESVCYYRRTYPEAVVIVSTWHDEPEEAIERCRGAGAEIVLSDKPPLPGAVNVNFQTRTSAAGMKRAHELGCRFAAKTRTDHRIFAPQAFEFLISLLRAFPCRNAEGQNFRIISTNLVTSRYVPYHLSDLIVFGEIEDMLRYWNCPLNYAPIERAEPAGSLADTPVERTPEMYLCRAYLLGIGASATPTIRDWWQALADRFLIVDREMIDVYWPKYMPHIEYPSFPNERYLGGTNIRFRDWLRLCEKFGPDCDVPEFLLQRSGSAPPPTRIEMNRSVPAVSAESLAEPRG